MFIGDNFPNTLGGKQHRGLDEPQCTEEQLRKGARTRPDWLRRPPRQLGCGAHLKAHYALLSILIFEVSIIKIHFK